MTGVSAIIVIVAGFLLAACGPTDTPGSELLQPLPAGVQPIADIQYAGGNSGYGDARLLIYMTSGSGSVSLAARQLQMRLIEHSYEIIDKRGTYPDAEDLVSPVGKSFSGLSEGSETLSVHIQSAEQYLGNWPRDYFSGHLTNVPELLKRDLGRTLVLDFQWN